MNDKEKIRAEVERHKEHIGIGLNAYDAGYENGRFELCNDLLFFIDSLLEEADAVEGVVSYLVGADQAAIKYKDPSGIFMSYYAKRNGMGVGDKVKIVIFKEK